MKSDDYLFALSDEDLFDKYAPYITQVLPGFRPSTVVNRWVSRDPVAQPVITTGYQRRIPPFRTEINGFYICNTSQIYPEDRGTNYAIREGQKIAELMVASKNSVS